MVDHFDDEQTTDKVERDVLAASSVDGGAPSSSSWLGQLCSEATTLFITRRLSDAIVLLESGVDDDVAAEPIARAPKNLRIRFWSLYIATLDAVVELGPEKGSEMLDHQKWSNVAAKVQSGQIWEEVVRDGYHGDEMNVDEEVVVNLATFLLNHAPSQAVNQVRLHSYLFEFKGSFQLRRGHASSPDITDDPVSSCQPNDPKLPESAVLLFEIYTLHVLPCNGEWLSARRCFTTADVLDSDHYLEVLAIPERNKSVSTSAQEKLVKGDKSRITTTTTKREEAAATAPSSESRLSGMTLDDRNRNVIERSTKSKRTRRMAAGPAMVSGAEQQASSVLGVLRRYGLALASNVKQNTFTYFQTIFFTIGLLFAIYRAEYRRKLVRLLAPCWEKLSGTVRMGVRVNYL